MRAIAPEVRGVAKVQRWTPDDLLLVEAEIAARDAANTANRLRAVAFPASKRLDGFKVAASSVPRARCDSQTRCLTNESFAPWFGVFSTQTGRKLSWPIVRPVSTCSEGSCW